MEYYSYNEISYKKGYELESEDIYNAMNKKTTSLAMSQEALDSFINCVKTYCDAQTIEIDMEKLIVTSNKSLLVEGSVFGVIIDYEKLFETFKNTQYDQFLEHFSNIREAISICILNELGKKRTELEYALTLNEEVFTRFNEFRDTVEELFKIKDEKNQKYIGIDVYLDEYIEENLLNLQRNIIAGSPLKIAKNMLEMAKEKIKGEN